MSRFLIFVQTITNDGKMLFLRTTSNGRRKSIFTISMNFGLVDKK